MDTLRYVHAADLHLDTPFSGLAKVDANLAEQLRKATFKAVDRLVRLCIENRADFLLIAGDLYNQEERSIQAQLKLREMCLELDRHDIPVFIVHGNHDPVSSRISAISWPDNTTIFGSLPQQGYVEKNGERLAIIHGVSHEKDGESRNLAKLLHRVPSEDCLQIGLLHCNVDGAVQDHYAPCSLKDLLESGLDAWALGHAHKARILSDHPFIAYSGNIQGLHHRETGPKGCYVVTATRSKEGWQCKANFQPLAPVQWMTAEIALDGCNRLDEVEERLMQAVPNPEDTVGEILILDMEARGRTPLFKQLCTDGARDDFTSMMQGALPQGIYLRALSIDAHSPTQESANMERDDLLGEISRVCNNMANDPAILEESLQRVIAPLKKAGRGLVGNPEEPAKLLEQAARICQDLLEGH